MELCRDGVTDSIPRPPLWMGWFTSVLEFTDPGQGYLYAFALVSGNADLFLRIQPTPTTVHQGDLITYAFPVWNLGPSQR